MKEEISLFDGMNAEEQTNFFHTIMYVGYKNELMQYGNERPCSFFNNAWAKHYEDLISDKDIERFAVISDNTEVGFFIVRSGESAKKLGVDYYIEDVYLFPDYRGRGIMKKFAKAFFKKHSGRYGMELIGENKNATRFWCSVIVDNEWEKIPKTWRGETKVFYFRKGKPMNRKLEERSK